MLKSLKAVWRNPGDSVQVLRGDKLIFSNTGSFHYQTKTLVLKLQHAPGPQEDLSEHTSWSFALRVSESECLEQRPSNCTFSNLSDDVDGAGQRLTLDFANSSLRVFTNGVKCLPSTTSFSHQQSRILPSGMKNIKVILVKCFWHHCLQPSEVRKPKLSTFIEMICCKYEYCITFGKYVKPYFELILFNLSVLCSVFCINCMYLPQMLVLW